MDCMQVSMQWGLYSLEPLMHFVCLVSSSIHLNKNEVSLYRSALRTPQRHFLNFHSARTTLQLKAAHTAHTQLTQNRKKQMQPIIIWRNRPTSPDDMFFPNTSSLHFHHTMCDYWSTCLNFLIFSQLYSILLNISKFLNFFLSKLFSTFLPHPQIYNN